MHGFCAELALLRAGGAAKWPDGRAARMRVALHDIASPREAELAVQRMNEELELREADTPRFPPKGRAVNVNEANALRAV